MEYTIPFKARLKQELKLDGLILEPGTIVTVEETNKGFKVTSLTDETITVKKLKYEKI